MDWRAEGQLEGEILEEFIENLRASNISDPTREAIEDSLTRTTFSGSSSASTKLAETLIEQRLDTGIEEAYE